MNIRLNLSDAFLNKENLTRKQSAFGDSFSPATVTLTQLAEHIASGKAFTMHAFKGNRRIGTEWVSSQIVGLDLDDCPLSADEIAAIPDIRDHAWLVYPSPSHTPEKPKTRVLFVLPSAVTEPQRWQALQLGVMAHFANLNPDKACKDLARLFYGSTQPGHIVLGKVASWEWLGGLCLPLATADYEKELIRKREKRKPVPIRVEQGDISGNVVTAIERTLGITRYKSDGWSLPVACPFKHHEHDSTSPAGAWHRDKHIFYCQKCQGKQQYLAKETAAALGIEWPKQPPRLKRSAQHRAKKQAETIKLPEAATLAPFTADRTFSSRYVSDAPEGVLDAPCIALKSITGSGKSKWAASSTAVAPSLLTIAYRTAIVKAQAKDYDAMVYDALSGADSRIIASADRVSTTIDSLHKFSNRVFHTVVIDEWVSLVGHFSSAGTLKEKGAFTWDLLKRLITNATRVIVMDATLTDDSLAELRAYCEGLICIENTYVQPKVSTQILPNRLAFFSTALARIKAATAPVLLGVTSPAEARLTKDLIAVCYPEKRLRVVTVKQSHLNDTQAFIREINTRLSEIDVLIFNGAMSTGVDIQADVDSIICLINRPLAPSDGVQMLGRARNTKMRFARVPDSIEGLDCDPAEMFQNLELSATLTGVETSKQVRSLARLHARHEARRNAEMSNYLPVFRAYCHADGSDTQAAIVRFDKAVADQIKAIREAHTAQRKADVLDTARILTITPEMLDRIREVGEQEITPEIDAGYLRHKIEAATGQPINEPLFDKYHTKQARAALRRADISSDQNARDIDQRENNDSLPLHQRTNATGIKALFNDGLRALGANDLNELPAVINSATAENFKDFGIWATQNIKRFEALLGYRGGHDGDLSDAVKAVRYFLKRFGVTLARKQIMRDGQRFYMYSIDAQEIAELVAIIAQRRLKAAAERQTADYFKTAKDASMPFRSNRDEGVKTAPPTTKNSTGASHFNPFSRPQAATEAA